MARNDKQNSLRLAFGVHREPSPAPAKLVRLTDDEATAIDVCMKAAKLKGIYVAQCCGISEGYVSRLRKGERPVPDHLIAPLCAALGSLLLAQVRERIERENEDDTAHLVALLAPTVAHYAQAVAA